jgi:hemin uptake protein HemP
MNRSKPPAPFAAAPRTPPSATRTLAADALFGSAEVVHIVHRGEQYQLRRTRQGKLLLTK